MKNDGKPSEPEAEIPTRWRTIAEMMIDGSESDDALHRAVREALIRHKKLGNSIAVWRDGKAVIAPPDEIRV